MTVTALNDPELFARAFTAEFGDTEADAEIEARFGQNANDELASYFTASHASTDDMVRMANEQTSLLVEIAKGEHVHTGGTDTANGIFCRCGHRTAP